MKSKKIIISSLILVVLVIALVIDLSIQNAHKTEVQTELIKLNWDKVTGIKIQTTQENLELFKIKGEWFVLGDKRYHADLNKVEALINSFSVLRKNKIINKDEYQDKKRFNLDNPPVNIEIITPDKKIKLFLGTRTTVGEEVYAMLNDDDNVYLTNSYILIRLYWGVQEYRDKKILSYDPDKIIGIDVGEELNISKNPQGAWSFVLKTTDVIPDVIPADPEIIEQTLLGGISLEGIRIYDSEEELNDPEAFKLIRYHLRYFDVEGKEYELIVGNVNAEYESYYVKRKEPFPVYLVPIEIMNQFIKDKYSFADKWIIDPNNVMDVTLVKEKKEYKIHKQPDGFWYQNNKKLMSNEELQGKLLINFKALDIVSLNGKEFLNQHAFNKSSYLQVNTFYKIYFLKDNEFYLVVRISQIVTGDISNPIDPRVWRISKTQYENIINFFN